MARYRVTAEALIGAPSQKVYEILADYRQHHPRIVPLEYFPMLEVEEGGVGAGTRIRAQLRMLGVTKEFRHVVSEPEPGRVLVETDVDGSSRTTFTLEQAEGGVATKLTITTELEGRSGPLGALERLLTAMMLRRIYRKELALIAAYAAVTASRPRAGSG